MWWGAPQQKPEETQVAATLTATPVDLDVNVRPSALGARMTLAEGIRQLYERSEFCDVAFVAAGKQFPAHQAMLASMSSSFRNYLRQLKLGESQASAGGKAASGEEADAMEGILTKISDAVASGVAAPSEVPSPDDAATDDTSAGADRATATAATDLATTPAPAERTHGRLVLEVHGVTTTEAMSIMLSYVYTAGTGGNWGYQSSSCEVNKDVLRMARIFKLAHLHEHAARWLARGLTTANVVDRLVTCEEFGLGLLREKVLEQLTANPAELAVVSSSPEIMKHPRILQELLVRVATLAGAGEKRRPTCGALQPFEDVQEKQVKQEPSEKEKQVKPEPQEKSLAGAQEKGLKKSSTQPPQPEKPMQQPEKRALEKVQENKPTAKRAKRAMGA